MSDDLEDETTSINSIYGDQTLLKVSHADRILNLVLPSHSAICLRIQFPSDYPDTPPSILGTQSVGPHVAKGDGLTFVEQICEVLAEVYIPGSPCIFDLIEEAGSRIPRLDSSEVSARERPERAQTNGQQASYSGDEANAHAQQSREQLGDPPPWTLSEVVTEKKSIFVARAAPVASVEQARTYLAHLLATEKKVAKATHNITSWRIRGENGVQYQDCDDDGETAAGGRILHLMELMDVWGAMVVVTRWYGGVQLGPDRFRIINQTARDALVKGGFIDERSKEVAKKRGMK